MKNQYFGDIYDYIKYGLLRLFNEHGQVTTSVCWMLTEDGPRHDGHRIQYLQQPNKWSKFDPVLYWYLHEQVIERGIRNVNIIEENNILPNCRFYSAIVPDNSVHRDKYIRQFLEFAHGTTLVFFDPDNGMEVKSVPFGRKNSSKYIYWTEVKNLFSEGYSLLIYQHFPPKPRESFICGLKDRIASVTGVQSVYSYSTKRVVFFLIPQPAHVALFEKMNEKVTNAWKGQIKVEKHQAA